MQNIKRAIVTGATGFLGFSLVRYLLKQGVFVYCVCRPGSSNLPRLDRYLDENAFSREKNVKIIELDLHDLSKLPAIIDERCDVFFHLGWDGGVKIETGQDLNILTSAVALMSAVKIGCKRFIASGSQAEYGPHQERLFENSTLNPVTSYGQAKVAAYFLTKTLSEKNDIEHIWCRIFSAYGPGENPDTLIRYCITSLLNGISPQVTPCEQLWNYIYEDDVAQALYLLGTLENVSGVYNIGSNTCLTLREFLRTLHDIIKLQKPDIPEISFGARNYRFDQVMHLEPDISKLQNDTGFDTQVEFEQGIKNILEGEIPAK